MHNKTGCFLKCKCKTSHFATRNRNAFKSMQAKSYTYIMYIWNAVFKKRKHNTFHLSSAPPRYHVLKQDVSGQRGRLCYCVDLKENFQAHFPLIHSAIGGLKSNAYKCYKNKIYLFYIQNLVYLQR